MPYTVRPFQPSDMPFLWEMLFQSIYVPDGETPFDRSILDEPHIAKYLQDWGHPRDLALIAMDSDRNRAGAVWIRQLYHENPGYGFIDDDTPEIGMANLPEHRGKGLGSRLLLEMCNVARCAGIQSLSLSVDPRNQTALRLYQKQGFTFVYGDAGGSWTMKKSLA